MDFGFGGAGAGAGSGSGAGAGAGANHGGDFPNYGAFELQSAFGLCSAPSRLAPLRPSFATTEPSLSPFPASPPSSRPRPAFFPRPLPLPRRPRRKGA